MPQRTLDEYLKQWRKQATENQPQSQNQQKQGEVKYKITGFYKETQFQETPIGKISKEWNVMEFGEVFDFQRGFSYRKSDLSEEPTAIRFITIDDIEKEGGIKRGAGPVYLREGIQVINRFLLKEGDLLVANTDMSKGFIIGAPLYIDKNLVGQSKYVTYSMDLTKLLPKRKIDTKFFFYFLSWSRIRRLMKSFAHGTNVLHLNHNLVKKLSVAVPPLEEQLGIAEVLSSVDEAIEATERLIERLGRLKQGLMQELLTKGIGHKEFQETPIGKIPKEWKIDKLDDYIVIETGKRPKGGAQTNGEAISIGGEHIGENGRVVWAKAKFIPLEFYNKLDKGKVRLGDLLLVKDGAKTGKVAYVNELPYPYVAINEHVFIIRSKNQSILINKFLFYVLYSRIGQYQIKQKVHGIIGGIKRQDLLSLKIPLPPLEEQVQIADILKSVDDWIELEMRRKEKLERLKHGLMDLLLSGVVRVKVVKLDSNT